jgi:hypothetical protein
MLSEEGTKYSPSESHYYRDAIETTLNRIYCISTNPSSLNNVFQLFPNVNQHRSADIEKRLFQISYEDLAIGTLPKALTECIQELHKAANPALYPSRESVTRIKDKMGLLMAYTLLKKSCRVVCKGTL